MQVSSGIKNNSSPNEPSCTTITMLFNGVLLVVTGKWRSPFIFRREPTCKLNLDSSENITQDHCCGVHNVCSLLHVNRRRQTVANYLGWILVHSKLSKLSKPFRDAGDDLSRAMKGGVTTGKRWLICISEIEETVGFALSAMFVRETFPSDSKIMAQDMIQEIKQSFKDNLPSLKWMDPEAQKLAADKVDSMIETIGYPEFIVYPDEMDESYEESGFLMRGTTPNGSIDGWASRVTQVIGAVIPNVLQLDAYYGLRRHRGA
ncbi:endothelin-converting enzyme homolog [Trichonephila clavipes]|nr:endothelin-converting enzyme homolog [Trichonephila clavipes]